MATSGSERSIPHYDHWRVMSLEGKTAVITGASGGIGAAVARMLHERGVNVGLVSRARRRARARRRDGSGLRRARRRRAARASAREVAERFGGIDIVVANAGRRRLRLVPRPLARASRRDDRREPQGDALRRPGRAAAHARPGRATWSRSPRRRAGAGLPLEAVYCASKFGQVGFTRALDHELREHGIRCTNVCPGGVATEFALEAGRGPVRPRRCRG